MHKCLSLSLLLSQGYFSDTVMYYGYYGNYTLHKGCRDDAGGQNVSVSNGTRPACLSKHHSYNMPLAYFFTIGGAFFITCIILVYRYREYFENKIKMHL